MTITGFFYSLFLLSSLSVHAGAHFDRHEKLKGVSLQTGKEGDQRNYRAFTKTTLPYSASMVLNSIINYAEYCNNSLKLKRQFSDQARDCKYHNENIIESMVIKNLKTASAAEPGEVERFVVGRRIYNRGLYGHYELVKISAGKNKAGQKTHTINQRMLNDSESKTLIEPQIQKDSSYSESTVRFILTEISPTQTELKYIYQASTSHWILNKELSVAQVFSSLVKSANDMVKSISLEAERQTRSIASQE